MRTGVKGDGMCAGGTATANSDPRDGVQNGQQQHHVKECVRGHGSGDVVGIWCREAEEVNEHDFPDAAECRAVPFGIYDVTGNKGYVVVGTSNNTPEFAVNAIARWWEDEGQV